MLRISNHFWHIAAGICTCCLIAGNVPSQAGAVAAVLAGLLLAITGWRSAAKRHHLIADIPTSLIASAAQGYVELLGKCELHNGAQPLGFASGPPCVWQRYRVHERTAEGKQRLVSFGESTDTFRLRDSTGICVVDPEGAEFVGMRKKSWVSDHYHYDIEYLAPGDTVYALGTLTSQSGVMVGGERRQVVGAVLADWKRNRATLLERFDANGDGNLDVTEWEAARAAAYAEVAALETAAVNVPDLHILHGGADRQPYLVSSHDPKKLALLFRRWTWVFGCSLVFLTVTLVKLQA